MASQMETALRDYYAAWNAHDVERIASFFTDDCVYDDVPMGAPTHGKEELKASWGAFFPTCPDFKIEVKAIFATGDRAGSEWVLSGTQAADWPGMPSTGKGFSIAGASIMELQGHKIKRNSDYWDMVSMLTQLGVMLGSSAE